VGAFIQAIIGIYNTIMFFVERMKQIAAVAAKVIDSISAIANGVIGAAANKVEQTMAGLLVLVISFLARIAGLGKVSDAVVNFLKMVQGKVDQAIDAGIKFIVDKAKALFKSLFATGDKKDERTAAQKRADLDKAIKEGSQLLADKEADESELKAKLPAIKAKYKLVSLELVVDSKDESKETVHITGEVNPKGAGKPGTIPTGRTYMGAQKKGSTFGGTFGHADWKWTGYPPVSSVERHPANPFLSYQNNASVSKPSGSYIVSGSTAGAPVPTGWRDKLAKLRDGYKAKLMKPPKKMAAGAADNAARKQVESDYAAKGYSYVWQDLNVYEAGPKQFQGHHVKPINWKGDNVPSNLQYIPQGQHSKFTTWWEARKKEITDKLKNP